MENIAMWLLIILSVAIVILVIVGIRNTIVSVRENEEIKKNGRETIALITPAEQDKKQNAEGRLSLHLSVQFMANGKEINTQKDIIVKNFDAETYRAGKEITIRYRESNPERLVVLGNVTN